jgi:uncharacterized membrane protein
MMRTLRNNILIGLILITPLAVTALTINWLFTVITSAFLAFLPKPWREGDHELLLRVLALFVALALLFLVGLFVRQVAGRRLYRWSEQLLVHVPLINKIYVFVRQVLETLFARRQTLFKEVVVLEYPRAGVYSLGFVTAATPPTTGGLLRPLAPGDEYLSVFIPTTPNPTSGWFCIVARSQVIVLPMSAGEGMKLVISGGAVYPGTAGQEEPSLLDQLERWLAGQGRTDVRLPGRAPPGPLPEGYD